LPVREAVGEGDRQAGYARTSAFVAERSRAAPRGTVLGRESARRSEGSAKAKAIAGPDDRWRLNAAAPVAEGALVDHA
jgi:hypothetical protein